MQNSQTPSHQPHQYYPPSAFHLSAFNLEQDNYLRSNNEDSVFSFMLNEQPFGGLDFLNKYSSGLQEEDYQDQHFGLQEIRSPTIYARSAHLELGMQEELNAHIMILQSSERESSPEAMFLESELAEKDSKKTRQIKKQTRKIHRKTASDPFPATNTSSQNNQEAKPVNQNNITTRILTSAATTAIYQKGLVQQLLKIQCRDQRVDYQELITFATSIHQTNYFSLSSFYELMIPTPEASIKNVFIRYMKWFLQTKFMQTLLKSKVSKQSRLEYIRFKNRFLENLAFHKIRSLGRQGKKHA